MKNKLTYQVIEDNAGGLHLYAFNKNNKVVYAHFGFEFTPDQLILCLDELDKGMTTKEIKNNWEGCEDGDLTLDYEKTTSNQYGFSIIAENNGKGRELHINKMGGNAKIAFKIHEFESGSEASLLDANIIHSFDADSHIKTVLTDENRYECYIETSNGDVVEVPHIDDTEQMEIWLDGTGLSVEDLLDKVQGLEIWD